MIEWMIVAGAVPRGLCVKAHFLFFLSWLRWGGVGHVNVRLHLRCDFDAS